MMVVLLMLLAACNLNQETDSSTRVDDEGESTGTNVHYKILLQLDSIPPEVGTSISVVQDEKLYFVWAEIFEFPAIPTIDFETEEVLFVTAYSDGCGRALEYVSKERETLIVKLNYPDNIRDQQDIDCTEIALPKTYVVKMDKTNTTKGQLIDINRMIYEEKNIVQQKLD